MNSILHILSSITHIFREEQRILYTFLSICLMANVLASGEPTYAMGARGALIDSSWVLTASKTDHVPNQVILGDPAKPQSYQVDGYVDVNLFRLLHLRKPVTDVVPVPRYRVWDRWDGRVISLDVACSPRDSDPSCLNFTLPKRFSKRNILMQEGLIHSNDTALNDQGTPFPSFTNLPVGACYYRELPGPRHLLQGMKVRMAETIGDTLCEMLESHSLCNYIWNEAIDSVIIRHALGKDVGLRPISNSLPN